MPKRAETKKFLPGVYELPGGHIDFGEDIVEGLKREIFEEFGVHIEVGDPFAAFTYTNHIKGSHLIEVIYFATLNDSIETISLDPEDHSEYGWFGADELTTVIDSRKTTEDPEFKAMYKGFELLAGGNLKS